MHSESLVIMEDREQIDELISLAGTKQKGDKEPTVIALNEDVCRELAARGLKFKTLEDYGFSEGDIEDEALQWFRSFPNIKIDNKNIKETIVYDGLSVWWLVDETLYNSPFIFHRVKDIVKQVIILDHIMGTEAPARAYYARDNTPASRATEFICKSRNIGTVTTSRSSGTKRRLSPRLKAAAYTYGQWLRMFLRKAYWMFLGRGSRSRVPPGKWRILIFSGPSWENVYDLTTGELRKGDPYFDSVIELLRGENEVAFFDFPTSFFWGLSTMKEKKRQQQMVCRPLEYYLSMGVILKALKASAKLHADYQLLAKSKSFRQSLNLHDMPLYDLVGQNLSFFFSRRYLTMVAVITEMAKRMVEAENPDAIIVCGEFIPHERAIIAAAKSKNIPVLSVQHGTYSPYFPYYNHVSADLGPNGETNAPYCPIANKFAVYGEHDKDDFVRRAKFAEEHVVVTGQPRYDVLAKADRVFDREKIFDRLNLDPEKELIVWMTQSHGFTPQQNERNVDAVYNVVKSLNDVQLVIKLHPGENQKATPYRKDKAFKPVIIGGWGTITFELLYASDVVITHYCSTAVEAIIMGKPVIIIDFSGKPIPVAYVESGSAIAVYKEDVLASTIEDVLHGEKTRQRLARAQKKFIAEGNYGQDGQSSKRIADLIMQMVKERV